MWQWVFMRLSGCDAACRQSGHTAEPAPTEAAPQRDVEHRWFMVPGCDVKGDAGDWPCVLGG